jgi:PAS domain S-box-containing protein
MSDLNREQSDRAAAIAAAWYQALAGNGDLPKPTELVQPEFIDLIRQIIALSSEDQFQTEAARAIGGRLARLGYKSVDESGNAPTTLSQQLTRDLDPNQENSTHARLGKVLTHVFTDDVEQQPQAAPVEKERALQSYETEWKRFTLGHQDIQQKSPAILQALPDSLGIINLSGDILYYHVGSERKFIPSDKEIFKHIREYLPAKVADELLNVYQNVINTGRAQVHEYSVTFVKIGTRYFQDTIAPYMGNNVLVISRDITKQKQIEDDLRASEARYRSVVEIQNDLIGRFKPDGTITFVNKATERLLGVPVESIIGHSIFEFVPEVGQMLAQGAASYADILTTQNPSITDELKVAKANGEFSEIEIVTQAIFNAQGEAIEYQTTGRDVTELKRIEAALRESEERYRSVVEGQTELIVRFLPDATITFVNEAFCRFFSKSRQDILGSSAMDLVFGADKSGMAEGLANLKNFSLAGQIQPYQTRVFLANGEIRWLESTTRPIYGVDGSFSEFQSVARDITDLKQAYNILERQNELLRQLSDQLINIQEIERQRIARDLHDSVLNELGAMMIAPAETLTPQVVRDNYEQLIEQLRQTINGLRSPMLNYGLYAALEDLFDSMMDNPQAENIFTMEVPPSLARFDLNVELHLFRIIQQACDNAIQHAKARHIRVYGQVEINRVNLTVEDDGIGFRLGTETDLAHVLAQKHFGLVSMLERAKLIGAEVHIESHPGAGTQVRVLWEPQKTDISGEIL